MQPPRPASLPRARTRDPVRDGLVVLCMTVVALALGIGLHLQFALAFWLAVLAALSVYIALLSTHILLRRSDQVDDLRDEIARLEAKIATAGGAVRSDYRPGRTESMPASKPVAGAAEPQAPPAGQAQVDYWNYAPAAPPAAVAPRGPAPQSAREPETWFEDLSAPPPRLRPSPNKGPSFEAPARTALAPAPLPAVVTPMHAALPPQRQVDADAEQINAVIKKLAADITQGQAAMALTAAAREDGPPNTDKSVAALNAVADAMRDSAFEVGGRAPVPPAAALAPKPVSAAVDQARQRLALVADAIELERFDVMLEPILGLSDRRAQHYVVTIRVNGDSQDASSDAQAVGMARGSGLLPLLDAVKVERAARVAWRMEDRGKPGSLFSQLSGESLVSDRFLNRFADTYRQGDTLGSRLVLGFRQAEVRGFSELQWSTLRDMADLGFRFCLEAITDLDLDFEALSAAGFTFARLDAEVFFNGLPAVGSTIPAADICRHFAKLDLAVIVSEIADEDVARRLLACGVELGQGRLFGSPRAVKADVLRNPHAAVA